MKKVDWLVTEDGTCHLCKPARDWNLLAEEYRPYRFLTELEDATRLATVEGMEEERYLSGLRMLVRKLTLNCYQINDFIQKKLQEGKNALLPLYDDFESPITIQLEMNLYGETSPIHNHGNWGIVMVLQGKQKNILWKRNPTPEFPDKISYIGEKILHTGDIISLTGKAIHNVEAIAEEPTITLNLYGPPNGTKRFIFDQVNHTAKYF